MRYEVKRYLKKVSASTTQSYDVAVKKLEHLQIDKSAGRLIKLGNLTKSENELLA